MTHPQINCPLPLRIVAAGCVVLWLAGVSACSLEPLFSCNSHCEEALADAGHDDSHDAAPVDAESPHSDEVDARHSHNADTHHHSHDAERPSRGSDHHDHGEGSCCSTLKATTATAKPIVIAKPALQHAALLLVLLEAHIAAESAPDKASDRPPSSREWVFTPEVCTGPANRSHAPPVFV